MEFGSLEREVRIDASPEVVFEVISNPDYIREWWSAETAVAAVVGSADTLTWTDESTGRQSTMPLTVVESDPPRRFAFRWTEDADVIAAPDNSTLVTFDLIATGSGTTLRLVETGFRERGWEAAVLEERYNDHRQGWEFYLPRIAATARDAAAKR